MTDQEIAGMSMRMLDHYKSKAAKGHAIFGTPLYAVALANYIIGAVQMAKEAGTPPEVMRDLEAHLDEVRAFQQAMN